MMVLGLQGSRPCPAGHRDPEVYRRMSDKKICFTASSGGHLEEILELRSILKKYDSFLLTEKTRFVTSLDPKRTYYLRQCSRHDKSLLLELLWNSAVSLGVFIKERPNAVITTGALATIPFCLMMKLFHKKLIFIESYAKVSSTTRIGRFLYRYADRFYVQWGSMLGQYPDAVYAGSIY